MKAGKLLLLLLLLVLLWPASSRAGGFQLPAATPLGVDFWGQLTFKGEPAQPGDQVGVFDPQGVCCGVATVSEQSAVPSLYPFVRVYGDDSATPHIDEGAVAGDVLSFRVFRASEDRVYGASVRLHVQDPEGPDPPRWVAPPAPLSAWQVDVEVVSLLWEMPNQNVPFGFQFEPLDLDRCLAEPGGTGQVAWSAEALGPSLAAEIVDGHVLVVTAPAAWSGAEVVRVTGTLGVEAVSQEVVFTVGANAAPVLGPLPGPQGLAEGERLQVEVEAGDPDGNALTLSLGPEVPNARLEPLPPGPDGEQRALFVFRPDYDQAGDYSFSVTASDGYLAAEDSLEVRVREVAGATVVRAWDLTPGRRYELQVAGTGTRLDGLSIVVPRGALAGPVRLTASLIDDSLLPPLPEGSFGFRFHLGPSGLVFREPVKVVAPYGESDPVGDQISVYRCGEGVSGWSTAYVSDVTIDRAAHTVSFRTERFSSFTPAATQSAPTFQADTPSGGGAGGGCFIATAAFGSPLEGHVAQLRLFRDRWLLASSCGRLLVAGYYQLSPAAARFIAGRPGLRAPVRAVLYPVAALCWAALHLPATLGLALAAGGVSALARRRRP